MERLVTQSLQNRMVSSWVDATTVDCYKCTEQGTTFPVTVGDVYRIHLNMIHEIEEYDPAFLASIHQQSKKHEIGSKIDFIEVWNNKIQEIQDVVEGRVEPRETDLKEVNEEDVTRLFSSLRERVRGWAEEEVASSPAGPRWYQGTFYSCNTCNNLTYGGDNFRNHLNKEHAVDKKTVVNLKDFAHMFEEKSFSCQVCFKMVPHEMAKIRHHIKYNHKLGMDEYESQYINGNKQNVQPKISNFFNSPAPTATPNSPHREGKRKRVEEGEIENPQKMKGTEEMTKRTSKLQTMFYCPLPSTEDPAMPCKFHISKDVMRNTKEAGQHLLKQHSVTPADMQPGSGRFTFRKVKLESSDTALL